jgi:hypothetical protein
VKANAGGQCGPIWQWGEALRLRMSGIIVTAILLAAWTFLRIVGTQRVRMIHQIEVDLQRQREHAKAIREARPVAIVGAHRVTAHAAPAGQTASRG